MDIYVYFFAVHIALSDLCFREGEESHTLLVYMPATYAYAKRI